MNDWAKFRRLASREIRQEEVMAENAAPKKPSGRGRPKGATKKKATMAIYRLPDAEKFGKELLELMKKFKVDLE
jgi:hypothetical protein